MKSLFLYTLFLQAADPVSQPAAGGFLSGMTVLEQLLFSLMLIVFLAGMGSIIRLSFGLMEMQRLRLLKEMSPEQIAEVGAEVIAPTTPWWKELYDKLTDTVPVEKEGDILLDHDYDGVMELDNNLPPWWKGIMYVSMIFAPIYLYIHHFSDYATSSQEAYAIEMEVADEEIKAYLATQENTVDESTVTVLADADALGNGKLIYDNKCAVCHGGVGEGGIGPNLTDIYWLHGGSIGDVFKTIKDGVPSKGMIAWKNDLRPRDIQEVASYISSLSGTNPPNAKEPQGQPYAAEAEDSAEETQSR